MSDTIVDMAKVTQMLDSGWTVQIRKYGMESYFAKAMHDDTEMMAARAVSLGLTVQDESLRQLAMETAFETDDFTPEQALTRLAYKVLGEII